MRGIQENDVATLFWLLIVHFVN